MKEAIMLLIVLLIGVITSQSFGYNVSFQDTNLLNAVYNKVDYLKLADVDHLQEIFQKLPPVISHFEGREQESFLLSQIYDYVNNTLNPQVASTSNGTHPAGLIEALGEMFQ